MAELPETQTQPEHVLVADPLAQKIRVHAPKPISRAVSPARVAVFPATLIPTFGESPRGWGRGKGVALSPLEAGPGQAQPSPCRPPAGAGVWVRGRSAQRPGSEN